MSRRTDLDRAARRAADVLRPPELGPSRSRPPSPVRRRKATVLSRNDAAGTVDLIVGDDSVEGVPYVAGATPMTGDTAWMENVDGGPLLRDVYPRPWTAMTTANGATNWGGRSQGCACRPVGDRRVTMRGIITLAAGGVGIGQVYIPAGFAPTVDQWLPCVHYTGSAYAAGLVKISVGFEQIIVVAGTGGNLLYLDGLTWTLD